MHVSLGLTNQRDVQGAVTVRYSPLVYIGNKPGPRDKDPTCVQSSFPQCCLITMSVSMPCMSVGNVTALIDTDDLPLCSVN